MPSRHRRRTRPVRASSPVTKAARSVAGDEAVRTSSACARRRCGAPRGGASSTSLIARRDGGGQDHRVRRARLDVDQHAAREASRRDRARSARPRAAGGPRSAAPADASTPRSTSAGSVMKSEITSAAPAARMAARIAPRAPRRAASVPAACDVAEQGGDRERRSGAGGRPATSRVAPVAAEQRHAHGIAGGEADVGERQRELAGARELAVRRAARPSRRCTSSRRWNSTSRSAVKRRTSSVSRRPTAFQSRWRRSSPGA